MTSHSQDHPARVSGLLAVIIFMICTFVTVATAQDQPPPKWEVFGGYSMYYPYGTIHGRLPGALLPLSSQIETNPRGVGGSLTYNFNRWAGFTADSGYHWGSGETTAQKTIDDARFFNLSFGPKVTYRRNHFAPFAEVLVGWHRLDSELFGVSSKVGVIAGGGLDIPFRRHIALRLLQVDYVGSTHHYGLPGVDRSTRLNGGRAQAGVTFMFGGTPEALVLATCSASPSEVMPGEPVNVTVTPSNFDPNHTLTYDWSATAGHVNGTSTTGTVDTSGLAAGSYTVTARVKDARRRNNGEATCNSSFTVKELAKNPPTITCAANPSTVQVGGSSTITSNAKSPDGRPLTYSYTSNAGSISGTTETANLNTSGASSGAITVTCNTLDDRGMSASSMTTVNVEAPMPTPPPATTPQASKINQIDFKKNSPRVDNAAKAILDEVALRMQRDSDARLVLVGESASGEAAATRLASQRGFNTKAYLVKEKGIDANRIDVRTGNSGNMQTEIWLVPAGTTFNNEGTMAATERAARKKK